MRSTRTLKWRGAHSERVLQKALACGRHHGSGSVTGQIHHTVSSHIEPERSRCYILATVWKIIMAQAIRTGRRRAIPHPALHNRLAHTRWAGSGALARRRFHWFGPHARPSGALLMKAPQIRDEKKLSASRVASTLNGAAERRMPRSPRRRSGCVPVSLHQQRDPRCRTPCLRQISARVRQTMGAFRAFG
jgi:hypothetical protein